MTAGGLGGARDTRRWIRRGVVVALLAGLAFAPFFLAPFVLSVATLGLIYGLFAFGLDLSWGRAGLLSVGQAAFFGIGAYAVVIGDRHGLPLAASVILGVVGASLLALTAALIALAVAEAAVIPLLILLTLGFSQLLERIAQSLSEVTGGSNGAFVAGLPLVSGYYAILGCVVLVVVIANLGILQRNTGMVQVAALVNSRRAEQLGADLRRARLIAVVSSGAVSSIAGVLFALTGALVTPASLGLAMSTSVLTWLALGGKASIVGPFVGAMVLTAGQQAVGGTWSAWYVFAVAALFVVVVLAAPDGLVGFIRRVMLRDHGGQALPTRVAPSRRRQHRVDTAAPLLEVSGVDAVLGGTQILHDVSFSVERGQCVCLIGPNGAGKSTLLGVIAGSVVPSDGRVRLADRDVTRLPPYRRALEGMGRLFQTPQVFTELSVHDNRRFAALLAGRVPDAPVGEEALVRAGDLSMAQQRNLEFDMVVEGPPELLLLDEPAAGLSHDDTRALAARIRGFIADGRCGAVIVEHDMELVRELADRVIVLAGGRIIADGTMDEVIAHDEVRAAYLGTA